MPIPFHKYDYLKIKDLERCPYPPFRNHPEFTKWNDNDDRRMLLIALDRYADKLKGKNK
jgi:hypothetical protein